MLGRYGRQGRDGKPVPWAGGGPGAETRREADAPPEPVEAIKPFFKARAPVCIQLQGRPGRAAMARYSDRNGPCERSGFPLCAAGDYGERGVSNFYRAAPESRYRSFAL